jgi:phenol 2-monooxygenase (NADPH)
VDVEIFEAFGFAERVLKEAYWVSETVFWKPDPNNRDHIVRSGRIQDVEDDLSEMPHLILSQARVHDMYLDLMRHSASRLEPDYGLQFAGLDIDSAPDAPSHPVTVRLTSTDGIEKTVRARYVVGCDGARSGVRRAIGREPKGDSANQAWGVMDILAQTDFPDIRFKAVIQSNHEGNILVIPREGGYMVRLYIELDKLQSNERVAARNITADYLVAAAQRIVQPYTLDVKEIVWWSVYEIGQRLCDRFDDVPADQTDQRTPRVFIAGDACHTHSPKAGQGMNVSMQDAFNLGWKLAAVLRGQCDPALLHSYTAERQAIASELIEFDRAFARMISAPPKDPNDPSSVGVTPAEFQAHFQKQGRYTAGTATHYRPSALVGAPVHQHLAAGQTIGMRFHSAPVIRLADAKPMQLGHVVKADGRWRLMPFADPQRQDLAALCDFLASDPRSPLPRYTQVGRDPDALIDVRAVLQQGHRDVEYHDMPALLRPTKGRLGLIDTEKIFCSDLKSGVDIFALRGIARSGCAIIVRPDQYVANVLPLHATAELSDFFAAVLLPTSP